MESCLSRRRVKPTVGPPKDEGMSEQAIQWLKDGGEKSAAAILSDCELDLLFVDLLFELGGEREFELYDVNIAAPRRILDGLEESYSQEKSRLSRLSEGLPRLITGISDTLFGYPSSLARKVQLRPRFRNSY